MPHRNPEPLIERAPIGTKAVLDELFIEFDGMTVAQMRDWIAVVEPAFQSRNAHEVIWSSDDVLTCADCGMVSATGDVKSRMDHDLCDECHEIREDEYR